MGVDGQDVGLHDVTDAGLIAGQEHPPHRDHPQQHTVLGDIAGVDGLLVHAHLADAGEGLLHRGVGVEIDVLRGHNGPGGVFGVVQQLVDLAAGGGVGVPQDSGDQVGGHILDQVHRVVQIQLVQNLPQLLVAEGVDEALLVVGVLQFGKHLRRYLLGQQTEHQDRLLRPQPIQKFGDVHLVHIDQQLPQPAELPGLDQLHQLLQIVIFMHDALPLRSVSAVKAGHKKTTGRAAPVAVTSGRQTEGRDRRPLPALKSCRGCWNLPVPAPRPPVRDSASACPGGDFGLP